MLVVLLIDVYESYTDGFPPGGVNAFTYRDVRVHAHPFEKLDFPLPNLTYELKSENLANDVAP